MNYNQNLNFIWSFAHGTNIECQKDMLKAVFKGFAEDVVIVRGMCEIMCGQKNH